MIKSNPIRRRKMELGKVKGTVTVVDSEAILAEAQAATVSTVAPVFAEMEESVTQDA